MPVKHSFVRPALEATQSLMLPLISPTFSNKRMPSINATLPGPALNTWSLSLPHCWLTRKPKVQQNHVQFPKDLNLSLQFQIDDQVIQVLSLPFPKTSHMELASHPKHKSSPFDEIA